jgi:hypothetical protein
MRLPEEERMAARTELWNIRIHEGHLAGRADLFIDGSGNVKGTLVFPTLPSEESITGHVSGSSITLERKLTGPFEGKVQIWTGGYNGNGSAAQGTAKNGGTYNWSASIAVQ